MNKAKSIVIKDALNNEVESFHGYQYDIEYVWLTDYRIKIDLKSKNRTAPQDRVFVLHCGSFNVMIERK